MQTAKSCKVDGALPQTLNQADGGAYSAPPYRPLRGGGGGGGRRVSSRHCTSTPPPPPPPYLNPGSAPQCKWLWRRRHGCLKKLATPSILPLRCGRPYCRPNGIEIRAILHALSLGTRMMAVQPSVWSPD